MFSKPETKQVILEGTKVAIATPSYGNSVHSEYASSLAATFFEFAKHGMPCSIFNCSDAILTKARNVLVDMFLNSDNEYLLFIDSDMAWDASVAIRLLAGAKLADHKIAAVAGRQKTPEAKFCVQIDKEIFFSQHSGFLKIKYVGTAFMLIHKSVFETLKNKQNYFNMNDGNQSKQIHAYFEDSIEDGDFWSEDYNFCRKCQKEGIEIYLDHSASLKHFGHKAWSGAFSEDLSRVLGYIENK